MTILKTGIGCLTVALIFNSGFTLADMARTKTAPQQKSTPATANEEPSNKQPSHQEILTHLLEAEMALQRNMFDVALTNYLFVAEHTHDIEAAQTATELAIELQATDQALKAAKIWAQAAPQDLQAQLVALALYVNSDQFTEAEQFLHSAINLHDQDIDQHLLLILTQSSDSGQDNLSKLMNVAAQKYDQDPILQLAAAQIAAAQLDIANATSRTDAALKLQPNLTGAIELKAKLIRHGDTDDKAALAYLDKQVKKYPKDGELRMFYISALLDGEQISKAKPHLQILSKDTEYGGDALIILGELAVEQNDYKTAAQNFKLAAQFPSSADKARFYSGQIAELNGKDPEAIEWYEKVSEDSELHTPAFLRAAYLYSLAGNHTEALNTLQNTVPNNFADQKQVLLSEIDILIDADQLDKALENSNKLLTVLPDDVDFLYARSVVLGLLHKNKEAERDLRAILALDPENSLALNALGFTLTNQPNRVKEAMPFLEKALALNPDNPVIMDSMGWLLFKLGRNEEAIAILDKAYKLSGDSEIAAHLGEVLWTTGNKEAAKKVWSNALSSTQNNTLLQETINRLNVPIAELSTPSKQGGN